MLGSQRLQDVRRKHAQTLSQQHATLQATASPVKIKLAADTAATPATKNVDLTSFEAQLQNLAHKLEQAYEQHEQKQEQAHRQVVSKETLWAKACQLFHFGRTRSCEELMQTAYMGAPALLGSQYQVSLFLVDHNTQQAWTSAPRVIRMSTKSGSVCRLLQTTMPVSKDSILLYPVLAASSATVLGMLQVTLTEDFSEVQSSHEKQSLGKLFSSDMVEVLDVLAKVILLVIPSALHLQAIQESERKAQDEALALSAELAEVKLSDSQNRTALKSSELALRKAKSKLKEHSEVLADAQHTIESFQEEVDSQAETIRRNACILKAASALRATQSQDIQSVLLALENAYSAIVSLPIKVLLHFFDASSGTTWQEAHDGTWPTLEQSAPSHIASVSNSTLFASNDGKHPSFEFFPECSLLCIPLSPQSARYTLEISTKGTTECHFTDLQAKLLVFFTQACVEPFLDDRAQLLSLYKQISTVQAELDLATKLETESTEQVGSLKDELESANQFLRKSNDSLDKSRSDFIDVSAKLNATQEELEQHRAEFIKKEQELHKTCKDLRDKLSAAENEHNILQAKNTEYEQQIASMEMSLSCERKAIRIAQSKIDVLDAALIKAQHDIEQGRSTINKLQAERSILAAETEQNERTLAKHTSDQQRMKEKLIQLRQDNENLCKAFRLAQTLAEERTLFAHNFHQYSPAEIYKILNLIDSILGTNLMNCESKHAGRVVESKEEYRELHKICVDLQNFTKEQELPIAEKLVYRSFVKPYLSSMLENLDGSVDDCKETKEWKQNHQQSSSSWHNMHGSQEDDISLALETDDEENEEQSVNFLLESTHTIVSQCNSFESLSKALEIAILSSFPCIRQVWLCVCETNGQARMYRGALSCIVRSDEGLEASILQGHNDHIYFKGMPVNQRDPRRNRTAEKLLQLEFLETLGVAIRHPESGCITGALMCGLNTQSLCAKEISLLQRFAANILGPLVNLLHHHRSAETKARAIEDRLSELSQQFKHIKSAKTFQDYAKLDSELFQGLRDNIQKEIDEAQQALNITMSQALEVLEQHNLTYNFDQTPACSQTQFAWAQFTMPDFVSLVQHIVTEFSASVESLQQEILDLKGNKEGLQQQLSNMTNEVVSSKEDSARKAIELQEAKANSESQSLRLESAQERINLLKQDYEELRRTHSDKEAEAITLRNQIDSLEEEKQKAWNERRITEQTCVRLEAEKLQAWEACKSAEKACLQAESLVQEAERSRDLAEKEAQQMESNFQRRLETLEAAKVQVEQTLDSRSTELAMLGDKYEQTCLRLDEEHIQLTDALEALTSLETKMESAQQELEDALALQKNQSDINEALQYELYHTKTQFDQNQAQYQDLHEQHRAGQNRIMQLQDRVAELQNEVLLQQMNRNVELENILTSSKRTTLSQRRAASNRSSRIPTGPASPLSPSSSTSSLGRETFLSATEKGKINVKAKGNVLQFDISGLDGPSISVESARGVRTTRNRSTKKSMLAPRVTRTATFYDSDTTRLRARRSGDSSKPFR